MSVPSESETTKDDHYAVSVGHSTNQAWLYYAYKRGIAGLDLAVSLSGPGDVKDDDQPGAIVY